MFRKIICAAALSLLACLPSKAIIVQQLVKTNGDKLFGFICSQDPAAGKIVFRADSAVETVNKVFNMGGRQVVVMGNDLMQVKIVRQGDDGRAVCEIGTRHDVEVKWDEIKAVYAIPNSEKNTISGLEREYTTYNGDVYRGQFQSQVYGDNSRVTLRTDDKREQSVLLNNVAMYKTIPANASQPVIEQAKLTDVIELKDGQVMSGVIVERNYENENADSFYVVLQERKKQEKVFFNQIKRFRAEVNSSYKPYIMHTLKSGEIMVNGNMVDGRLLSLTRPFSAEQAEIMKNENEAFVYMTQRAGNVLRQAIGAYLPSSNDFVHLKATGDSCMVTVEVNDHEKFDGQSSMTILKDVTMEEDGKTLTLGDYAPYHNINAKSLIKDGRSGTFQYKFRLSLPKQTATGKKNPTVNKKYFMVYFLKTREIIPLEVEMQSEAGKRKQAK